MATVTVVDTTFTVDSTAVLLSSSSHPTLGLQMVHFSTTPAIPEGSTVARTAAIAALSGTSQAGVAKRHGKEQRTNTTR